MRAAICSGVSSGWRRASLAAWRAAGSIRFSVVVGVSSCRRVCAVCVACLAVCWASWRVGDRLWRWVILVSLRFPSESYSSTCSWGWRPQCWLRLVVMCCVHAAYMLCWVWRMLSRIWWGVRGVVGLGLGWWRLHQRVLGVVRYWHGLPVLVWAWHFGWGMWGIIPYGE